jgi:hypothetical protein
VRVVYAVSLSRVEQHAGQLERKTGEKWHSLGGTPMLDRENGEREGAASSCILVRAVHAYE